MTVFSPYIFKMGNEGFRSVDYSPRDYDRGIVNIMVVFKQHRELFFGLIQLMVSRLRSS